jgi:hypothetical protein
MFLQLQKKYHTSILIGILLPNNQRRKKNNGGRRLTKPPKSTMVMVKTEANVVNNMAFLTH